MVAPCRASPKMWPLQSPVAQKMYTDVESQQMLTTGRDHRTLKVEDAVANPGEAQTEEKTDQEKGTNSRVEN